MKAIMACDVKGGIGVHGGLPWPKDDRDLQRFKELTLNQTVLMGRNTWESKGMPKPLPKRRNIVVTNRPITFAPESGLISVNNTRPDTMEALKVDWVIGGAKLVEDVWDQIDEFHLTRFRKHYICDTNIQHLLWRLEQEFKMLRCQICLTHQYQIWKRR